ncbi:unnamed protein product [Soboliphyme baturini]|uniref:Secreted protein n=1 Tax=Soboliphyme baturini TaxID=241478 RepID=A0A183I8V3_9BILA|nr:unnamed protein product [Soboliphyme baturini]
MNDSNAHTRIASASLCLPMFSCWPMAICEARSTSVQPLTKHPFARQGGAERYGKVEEITSFSNSSRECAILQRTKRSTFRNADRPLATQCKYICDVNNVGVHTAKTYTKQGRPQNDYADRRSDWKVGLRLDTSCIAAAAAQPITALSSADSPRDCDCPPEGHPAFAVCYSSVTTRRAVEKKIS